MAQAKQDMGSGSVKKLMLQLMIPAVVAQVVNLLYNIVDRIYIGHIEGIGAAALTGVGLFTPILMLLNAFAMLVGAGGAPRTAIALGQGDRQQAEKIISNSFTVLMLFAVVLTIGFYAGAPALLRLFGASHAQSLMLLSRISAKTATPFIQRLFPCSSTQRIPKQIQRVNSMFNPQNFSVSVSENAKSYGSWEIPANNSKRKK